MCAIMIKKEFRNGTYNLIGSLPRKFVAMNLNVKKFSFYADYLNLYHKCHLTDLLAD